VMTIDPAIMGSAENWDPEAALRTYVNLLTSQETFR
jgi:hypothetical protein